MLTQDQCWDLILHSKSDMDVVIVQIQLDAFKAGAEWAAQQCDKQVAKWGIQASIAAVECRDIILSASSNLKEIPK